MNKNIFQSRAQHYICMLTWVDRLCARAGAGKSLVFIIRVHKQIIAHAQEHAQCWDACGHAFVRQICMPGLFIHVCMFRPKYLCVCKSIVAVCKIAACSSALIADACVDAQGPERCKDACR